MVERRGLVGNQEVAGSSPAGSTKPNNELRRSPDWRKTAGPRRGHRAPRGRANAPPWTAYWGLLRGEEPAPDGALPRRWIEHVAAERDGPARDGSVCRTPHAVSVLKGGQAAGADTLRLDVLGLGDAGEGLHGASVARAVKSRRPGRGRRAVEPALRFPLGRLLAPCRPFARLRPGPDVARERSRGALRCSQARRAAAGVPVTPHVEPLTRQQAALFRLDHLRPFWASTHGSLIGVRRCRT